jgi:hypothetical protein
LCKEVPIDAFFPQTELAGSKGARRVAEGTLFSQWVFGRRSGSATMGRFRGGKRKPPIAILNTWGDREESVGVLDRQDIARDGGSTHLKELAVGP